mmetsp:Transcript_101435/g.316245  ORF Transcript_101435/g.316245 Transcript_101435/m.316245 type:complete len:203 (-) Transcript_101435:1277-1885(-)
MIRTSHCGLWASASSPGLVGCDFSAISASSSEEGSSPVWVPGGLRAPRDNGAGVCSILGCRGGRGVASGGGILGLAAGETDGENLGLPTASRSEPGASGGVSRQAAPSSRSQSSRSSSFMNRSSSQSAPKDWKRPSRSRKQSSRGQRPMSPKGECQSSAAVPSEANLSLPFSVDFLGLPASTRCRLCRSTSRSAASVRRTNA